MRTEEGSIVGTCWTDAACIPDDGLLTVRSQNPGSKKMQKSGERRRGEQRN